MKKIGFIGLGIMGSGMVSNLAKAGYHVTAWNRTKSKAEALRPQGVAVADTPRQAADGQDVVITMLSDPPALEKAAHGDDGFIAGLKPGAVLIDCSTVDPGTSRKLASAAATKGAGFLDSPVAGSKVAAAEGQLILMVGGDEAIVNQVRPILDVLSKKMVYAGGVGMGEQLKLCFNLMVGLLAAGLSETLTMAAKAGLDPSLVLEAIDSSILASKYIDWKGNSILNRDFSTNFSLKLMHKDLNLIMSAAYELNMPLPVTAAVKELYGTAKACCEPEEDFCSVVKALETIAGVEVKSKASS